MVFWVDETNHPLATERRRPACSGLSLRGCGGHQFWCRLVSCCLAVVNALVFWAAAGLLSGLDVRSFGAALLGSLIYSALQLAIDFVLARLFPD